MHPLEEAGVLEERDGLPSLQVVEVGVKRIDQVVLGNREHRARDSKNHRVLLFEPLSAKMPGGLRMRKRIPVVGEIDLVKGLQVLGRVELKEEEHVFALASPFVTVQPHQLFQNRDARMLAGVGDLGALVMPATAGFEAAVPRKAVFADRRCGR